MEYIDIAGTNVAKAVIQARHWSASENKQPVT